MKIDRDQISKPTLIGRKIGEMTNGHPIYEYAIRDIGYEDGVPIFFGVDDLELHQEFKKMGLKLETEHIRKHFALLIRDAKYRIKTFEEALENYVDITDEILNDE